MLLSERVPPDTLVDRSVMARYFAADRPAPRAVSSGSERTSENATVRTSSDSSSPARATEMRSSSTPSNGNPPDVAAGEGAAEGREAELQKFVSFPFSIFMLVVFVDAIIVASGWRQEGGRIVLAFSYPGAFFCLVMIISDIREFATISDGEFSGSILTQYKNAIRASKEPMGVFGMFGWFAGIVAVTS